VRRTSSQSSLTKVQKKGMRSNSGRSGGRGVQPKGRSNSANSPHWSSPAKSMQKSTPTSGQGSVNRMPIQRHASVSRSHLAKPAAVIQATMPTNKNPSFHATRSVQKQKVVNALSLPPDMSTGLHYEIDEEHDTIIGPRDIEIIYQRFHEDKLPGESQCSRLGDPYLASVELKYRLILSGEGDGDYYPPTRTGYRRPINYDSAPALYFPRYPFKDSAGQQCHFRGTIPIKIFFADPSNSNWYKYCAPNHPSIFPIKLKLKATVFQYLHTSSDGFYGSRMVGESRILRFIPISLRCRSKASSHS